MYVNFDHLFCILLDSGGDVIGPVRLDPPSSIPRMTVAEKKAYLGKRRIAAGGRRFEEMNNKKH